MGKEFFESWQLWQKMTFVLGCGIACTFIVGIIKLQYDNWKIRKYAAVEKGKQAQTPEMLEAQPVEPLAQQDTKDEIPFGIRAIESGIEVDGVWISRSNTPVGSSASSIRTEMRLPLSLNNSQLELPQAMYGSSRNSSRAPSSFDMATDAERVTANNSRSSSPARVNAQNPRGRAPAALSSRYSNPNMTRNSLALRDLEAEAGPSSTARYAPDHTTSNGSRTSDESDYMNLNDGRPYEPAYMNPRQVPVASSGAVADPRWDLDLLQSHRLSHVAETGQLTPRVRRLGNSGDWAGQSENMRSPQEISTINGVEYFVPQQKTPSPPLRPTASPMEEATIPSASNLNQDGHASHQARQAVPLLETYAPDAQRMYQPEAYQPEVYQPRLPQYDYDDQFTPQEFASQEFASQEPTSRNQRESQVIRKINSGFEILRPGTFGQPPNPEEQQLTEQNLGEKRQSKRLQKRRKSSSGSQTRTSHFVEQV